MIGQNCIFIYYQIEIYFWVGNFYKKPTLWTRTESKWILDTRTQNVTVELGSLLHYYEKTRKTLGAGSTLPESLRKNEWLFLTFVRGFCSGQENHLYWSYRHPTPLVANLLMYLDHPLANPLSSPTWDPKNSLNGKGTFINHVDSWGEGVAKWPFYYISLNII